MLEDPVEVVVQDHTLGVAPRGVVERDFLRSGNQPAGATIVSVRLELSTITFYLQVRGSETLANSCNHKLRILSVEFRSISFIAEL